MNAARELAEFAAEIRFDDLPETVVSYATDLFVDWVGSALAGASARQIAAIRNLAARMGPIDGASEILFDRTTSSPLFAALVNAAASHVAEQDDLHNASVLHPATVVFPPALALAQARGASGRDFLTAVVAGYEVGIRVGEFLGQSHYRVFHTTGTAGTLAAAAAAGRLLGLDAAQMLHCFGSAGTQAAGLWEFLRDGADSKQLHSGKAAMNGIIAADLAQQGFTAARDIFTGAQGMAAGMSSAPDVAALNDRLHSRWALCETSFKWHASCRHTHPAADALLALMAENHLAADDIAAITAHVHDAAIDVLGPVTNPTSLHQAKFSMGTVLAMVALHGRADVETFARHWNDPAIHALAARVRMTPDADVQAAYPAQWHGKVTVETTDGRILCRKLTIPRGDPGNGLSRDEIATKATALATHTGAASATEMAALLPGLWNIAQQPAITRLMPLPRA
ncbi:MAG: MmgE/PrpD family protein [Paracoccaceae bacterium]|nr:MmgE/PrpD family protein [Paracoccaceae bacterium]